MVGVSSGTLDVGESVTATAIGLTSTGESVSLGPVTWTSSAPEVASVSGSGVVSAVGPGAASIGAAANGKTGSASIVVNATRVASVTLTPPGITLAVGDSAFVVATVRDARGRELAGKTVTWQTSDGSVVGGITNGNQATIYGVGGGTAAVSAIVDSVTGTSAITVVEAPPKPVATVTIAPASLSLGVGQTAPMAATLRAADGSIITGRAVTWTTDNLSVINGSTAGPVLSVVGLASGSAQVFAQAESAIGVAVVTVTAAAPPSISLTCGGLAGGVVVAADGQYLGSLTNKFDAESILNEFGRFGSEFSSTSMYNPFSRYGSEFSSESAYNPFASSPPQLYVGLQFAAFVTKNTFKGPRVDPDALRGCAFP